ncbi:MAG: tetratricopeptide repeat protein [Nitrospinae bacterium]|nr:tetratricopeptide repeat protein [Nitrospinota bacterium]
MPAPNRIFHFVFLMCLLSILPQCVEKESSEYVQEAIDYTDGEKYDEAMASFLKAIKRDPRNAKAYLGLGGIYNFKNMHEKAVETFKTAVQLDPTYYDAHYGLGYTYEVMGRKEEADEEYRRYRELKAKMDAFLKQEEKSR